MTDGSREDGGMITYSEAYEDLCYLARRRYGV